ncbi:tetratricopeptide repeat protein [Paenibacillus nasutitermitis]|uniref:Tetratricopeptide repeat protein n=1 Tax=Paenibacillus nasutitermitis TaxID=1652958 RepID=A0A917DUV8_9BACL|nr:tetratricopeptide repeat protein [Paenibacillus nasutitermitis]GGD69017.1 hypothetical protein GCM10010911_28510 [Paenibacillus nasutitermitis]
MNGADIIKKAYEAILGGDFEQAIVRFEEAIELEPDNAMAYYRCSITCARSGKWAKALEYAQQAVKLGPEREEYRFHLRTVQAKQLVYDAEELLTHAPQETEYALNMLLAASRLDPLNMEALLLLGAAYTSLNRYDEALVYAREALRLDPEHSAAQRLFADIKRSRSTLASQRRKRKRNR